MIRELAERVKSHSFTEERGASEMVSILAMIGVVIALVGGVGIFLTDFSDNNLQQEPQAQIGTTPSANGVDLVVSSTTNVDELTLKVNGDSGHAAIDSASLSAEVGDVTTVGGSSNTDTLSDGDVVTVVATDNPNTNATALEYTHGS